MSKPASRQSKTSGTKFYTFESNALDSVEGAGRPRNNPFSVNSSNQTVLRMRNYEKEMEGVDMPKSEYLSADDQGLLIDYGRRVNSGEYGDIVKSSYKALVQDLSHTPHKAQVVKDIVNLLRVVDTEVKKGGRGNVQKAVMEMMYPNPTGTPVTQPAVPLRPQTGKKPSKFSDKPPTEMTETSTSSGIKDSPYIPSIVSAPSDSYIKAGEDKTRAIIEKSKSKSRSRGASVEKETVSLPPVDAGSLDLNNLPTLPDWEEPREPNMAERGLIQAGKDYKKIFGTDPTIVTQFQDMGGGLLYTSGESLGKKEPTPSRLPNAKDLDSDVPQDQQNQLALDNNQYYGANPYGISSKSMMEAEEKERRAQEDELKFYNKETQTLSNNNPIFEGAGTDVTGAGKGGYKDIDLLGSDLAPASWEEGNPRGMAESMKNRNVSQARDGSINVTIGGVALDDGDVRRNARNAGMSDEGLSPEEIRERDMYAENRSGGRLADRVGQAIMANANSMGSAGSGIVGQIGSLIDQSRDGGGRDRSREGLFGGDDSVWGGGDGFGQDLSNPRTLNERFSNLGLRRQGDKIDKYINMKNRGMMYSNLMGKGVSDPSIQSIRERKDDYIQPDGKHKGNSVNLIRQSNATSIRLNNMYMP